MPSQQARTGLVTCLVDLKDGKDIGGQGVKDGGRYEKDSLYMCL